MPDPMGGFEYGWPFIVGAAIAYLVGAIPFGIVISRLFGLADPRQIGSKNIGATNVLRTGNKAAAALTLVLDGGKGAVAAIIGAQFGLDMAVYAAGAAVLGHLFPVWLKFRGGKGVATTLGALLGVFWPVGVIACAMWLLTAAVFRFSSLAAIAAIGSAPLFAWLLAELPVFWLSAFLAVIVIARHHENIRRLLTGAEPKIGKGKKSAPDATRS